MLLSRDKLTQYGSEIQTLCKHELGEEVPLNGLTYFGIFSEEKELEAVAAIKCYMGYWYLRACVVKSEFRGRGLQQQLIRERLNYLVSKTGQVRVSVFPDNEHSIRNIEAMGFVFERRKKLKNGEIVLVYKKRLQ